jgi:hypothetical protein
MSPISSASAISLLFQDSFLLHLFSGPDRGSEMFLRNVGWLSTDYTVLYPRNGTLYSHGCENIKSLIMHCYGNLIKPIHKLCAQNSSFLLSKQVLHIINAVLERIWLKLNVYCISYKVGPTKRVIWYNIQNCLRSTTVIRNNSIEWKGKGVPVLN